VFKKAKFFLHWDRLTRRFSTGEEKTVTQHKGEGKMHTHACILSTTQGTVLSDSGDSDFPQEEELNK
jgi:hypothetical protein